MNASLEQDLQDVAAEVFESLAFFLPLAAMGAALRAPDGSQPWVQVGISFRGPHSGELLLEVPASMLPALAANMLAEPEVDEQQQQDAVKELLNVICGNLLPRISGSHDTFHVHPPAILPASGSAGASVPVAEVSLNLDAGQARLALFLGQSGPIHDLKGVKWFGS